MTALTEQEAAERQCPVATTAVLIGNTAVAAHRPNVDDTDGGPRCLGSRCMAWRWEDRADRIPQFGYCGLAGKP